MRMLMSLDTRMTSRSGASRCITTARIWLSPRAVGRAAAGRSRSPRSAEQASGGQAARGSSSAMPASAVLRRHQRRSVEHAAGLARVARHLGHALLVVVRPLPPASSSARRCRAPRSGTGWSGRASHVGVEHEQARFGPFPCGCADLGSGCVRGGDAGCGGPGTGARGMAWDPGGRRTAG